MSVSVLELFKIGLGPSSSHTVGPMKSARRFVETLDAGAHLAKTARITADLFGSLGATGKGHCTDRAIMLGLEGHHPDSTDPDAIPDILTRIETEKQVRLLDHVSISFDPQSDLVFDGSRTLDFHPNGMRFTARSADGNILFSGQYYSLGGGFVGCAVNIMLCNLCKFLSEFHCRHDHRNSDQR